MTNEEKFDYWLDHATYDLESAEAMYTTGRWSYVVFMCQQAIEKLVKGLYILYIDDNVPRVHKISAVFAKFEDNLKEPIRQEFSQLFDDLSQYYLRSRYPDYARELAAMTNKTNAEAVLNKTKEAWSWLLTMKPQTESSDNTSAK